MGAYPNHVLSQTVELRRQQAIQLRGSLHQGSVAPRLDEVRDRLSFGQVHPTIEESAPHKFSGLRHPRAQSHRKTDNPAHEVTTPMALEFDHVLAGQAMWFGEFHRDRTIENRAGIGIDDLAKIQMPRLSLGTTKRLPDPAQNLRRLRTGQPNDGNRTVARRRRGSNYSVFDIHRLDSVN